MVHIYVHRSRGVNAFATQLSVANSSEIHLVIGRIGGCRGSVARAHWFDPDVLGRTARIQFGETGTLRRLTQADGTEIKFAYDSDEWLSWIINARKKRYELSYDDAGRVVEERSFDKRHQQ